MSDDGVSSLTTTADVVAHNRVLTVVGVLDSTTYLQLRNVIIKAALDVPRSVIIDVTAMSVPAETALAVFTSARWHIGRWPDVPLLLVCRHHDGRDALRRNGISRYAPVHQTLDAALTALSHDVGTGGRRRARADLVASPGSVTHARRFAADCLTAWDHVELLPAVKVVLTALLENAFQHAADRASLRLESNGEAVTVAIDDTSTSFAGVREGIDDVQMSSLQIIDALCRAWGNAPTPTGKTVWAVIGPENRI